MCGDFTVKLLRYDLQLQRFCGLYNVNRFPTQFAPNCNPALLDIMACLDKSLYIHFDQLSLDGLSEHDLLFFVYDFNVSCAATDCIIYRGFNAIDTAAQLSVCSITDWSCAWFCADIKTKNSNCLHKIL